MAAQVEVAAGSWLITQGETKKKNPGGKTDYDNVGICWTDIRGLKKNHL